MSEKRRFVVLASVHEAGEALNQARALERDIKRVYERHFGKRTSVTCIWMEIPQGQAFIAGYPSTASTVLAPVPDDIEQHGREAFMSDMCDLFRVRTDCDVNEIIVTAMNVSDAKRYAKKARRRFDPKRAKQTMFQIVARMILKRPATGYLKTSLNMPK
ncbi:MAG: hypothetical protein AAF500_05715 [Myxococcota bacterium]